MFDFENTLIGCIRDNTASNKLEAYLDQILLWYTQIGTNQASKASNQLLKKYGEEKLKSRLEKIIDDLYTSQPMASERLFPLKLSEAEIKARYRKLIRIFHPDRGSNEQEWLNRRAEIINVAFEKYKVSLSNEKNKIKNTHSSRGESVHIQNEKNHLAKSSITTSSFFRKHSGEHRRYQRMIFIAAISFFSVILFLGFLSTLEFNDEPEAVAQNEKYVNNVSSTTNIDHKDVDLSMMELIGPESMDIKELLNTDTVDNEQQQYFDRDESVDIKGIQSLENIYAKDLNALEKEKMSISSLSIQNADKRSKFNEVKNSQHKTTANRLSGLDTKNAEKIEAQREVTIKNTLTSSVIEPSALKRADYSVDEVHEVLDQYRRAFAIGNVLKIMDLYMISAVHDNQRGQLKIARYFQEIFETTSSRSATLTSLLIVQEEYSQATVEGTLETKLTSESQQLGWTDSQRFRMTLLRDQEKLKISSFKTI